MFKYESKLKKVPLKIQYVNFNKNDNIFIVSDQFRLKQVLMNLIGNAYKFIK